MSSPAACVFQFSQCLSIAMLRPLPLPVRICYLQQQCGSPAVSLLFGLSTSRHPSYIIAMIVRHSRVKRYRVVQRRNRHVATCRDPARVLLGASFHFSALQFSSVSTHANARKAIDGNLAKKRHQRNTSRFSPKHLNHHCGGRSLCPLFVADVQVRPGHHGVLARWTSLPSGVRYRSRQKGKSLSPSPLPS